MAVGKEIKVTLTLDNNGFIRGTRAAGDAVQQMVLRVNAGAEAAQRIEHSYNSLGGRMHRLITTLGMARFALMDINDVLLSGPAAILKTAGEIERLTKLMEGLSDQATDTARKLEAASNVKFIFNMAQNAPFQVNALADAFVKLKTGGIDPTNGSLNALVNSIAKFGGSSDLMHRAAIAIQQMGGKGVVSMEELRQQLGEAVPTAMRDMAAGMGMTMAELSDRVKKGTVQATGAMNKMFAIMRTTNAGAATAMMETWTGLIERLKTRWELFKLDIANAGMFDEAKKAVEDLIAQFGRAGTGSLARDIGRFLNDAVIGVVELTRKIVELWDWIVMAGKAFAFYWAASRIAPMIAESVAKIGELRTAMMAQHTARMATIQREQEAMRRARVEEGALLAQQRSDWQNNLRSKIAGYREELGHMQWRHSAIVAEEAKLQGELRALRAAEAANNVNNIGQQAMVIRQLDELRGKKHQLANTEAALAARIAETNRVMAAGLPVMRNTAGVVSNLNGQLAEKNRHLVTNAARAAEATGRLSAFSMAASAMGSAVSAGIGWIKGMVFSLNGLILVLMAAAAAYDYFSGKARQAARDAATTARMQELTRRGIVQQDDVDAANRNIKSQQEKLAANRKALEQLRREQATRDPRELNPQARHNSLKARIEAIENENLDLIANIERNQRRVFEGEKVVLTRNAEMHAQDLLTVADVSADKAVAPYKLQIQKINKELDALDPQKDKVKVSKLTAQAKQAAIDAESARQAVLAEKKKEYQAIVNDASSTQEQVTAAKRALEGLAQREAEAQHWIGVIQSPNVFTESKDKKPKKPKKGPALAPTDALLEKIKEDATSILQAKGLMDKVNADIVDLAGLRAQATKEIDLIIEQDRHNKTVHTAADREKAIEQLTNRKMIEEALAQQKSLIPRVSEARERLAQMWQTFNSGNLEGAGDSREENRVLRMLERMRELAPGAAAEWDKVIQLQKEMVKLAAGQDLARFAIDNERDLRRLRLDVIDDTRARAKAAYEQEVQDLNTKYDAMEARAREHGQNLDVIGRQRLEQLQLLNERFALEMRTPMELMAREWKNVDENLRQAQTNWANGFVDMLTNALKTGKLEFKDFVKSVLADIASMKLKQTLADPLTTIMNGATNWLKTNVFGGGQAAMPTNDQLANGPLINRQVLQGTTDALRELGEQGAGGATQALVQQAVSTTKEMTVSEANSMAVRHATMEIENLAVAAANAATAMGGSSGGFGGLFSGLFGSGGGAVNLGTATGADLAMFFANGGIMTDMGPVPLRKYVNGGIARTPQAAIYAEGDDPEAYVPLPDGRSIPVTMTGGAAAPNVTVNVINQSGQPVTAKQGGTRFDGKQVILDVVLTAANQPGGFRDGLRNAVK